MLCHQGLNEHDSGTSAARVQVDVKTGCKDKRALVLFRCGKAVGGTASKGRMLPFGHALRPALFAGHVSCLACVRLQRNELVVFAVVGGLDVYKDAHGEMC